MYVIPPMDPCILTPTREGKDLHSTGPVLPIPCPSSLFGTLPRSLHPHLEHQSEERADTTETEGPGGRLYRSPLAILEEPPLASQSRSDERKRTWGHVRLPDTAKQVSQVFHGRGVRPQSRITCGWRQTNNRSVGRFRDRLSEQIHGGRELKM